MIEVIQIVLSLLPVIAFLAALILLDSYKLVAPKTVIATIVAGAMAAAACLFINTWIMRNLGIGATAHSRYIAPVIEESAKALSVLILFRLNRIGFLVDAAIYGFAVGSGFALVENLAYLASLDTTNILVWVVRGFGTAAMHAAAMVIFAVVSKTIADRARHMRLWIFAPGLLSAMILHSMYNHFILSPTLSTIMLLVVIPLLVIAIFERSERLTRDWLGVGFDADQELLRILTSGEMPTSRIGQYLQLLQDRFPGTVVADMFCLLRIHTELSLRAKGNMLLRQAGLRIQFDPEVEAKLTEMHFLENSIGKTGKLAILPFMHTSDRELWQLNTIK